MRRFAPSVLDGSLINRRITGQVSSAVAGLLGTSLIKRQEVALLLQMGLSNMWDSADILALFLNW